jgi:hypothetical protein
MATVTRILCQVLTENVGGAGTDGNVYLGLGGREFRLDTPADDFERGSWFEYIMGDGANINSSDDNDPRQEYVLDTTNLDHFPVYVRFEPQSSGDRWKVAFIAALAYRGDPVTFAAAYYSPLEQQGLWMGTRSGKVIHLTKILGEANASTVLAEGERRRGAKR